jgi:hypothetical protein
MVRVKIKNIMFERKDAYFFEVPEFLTYEGDEVKLKWIQPNQMALSTGSKDFPERVLERSLIIEIDGLPYSYDHKPKYTVKQVRGSKGKVYTVTGDHHCTCPGFTFRGSCKHLKERENENQ